MPSFKGCITNNDCNVGYFCEENTRWCQHCLVSCGRVNTVRSCSSHCSDYPTTKTLVVPPKSSVEESYEERDVMVDNAGLSPVELLLMIVVTVIVVIVVVLAVVALLHYLRRLYMHRKERYSENIQTHAPHKKGLTRDASTSPLVAIKPSEKSCGSGSSSPGIIGSGKDKQPEIPLFVEQHNEDDINTILGRLR